jgi:predicted permease
MFLVISSFLVFCFAVFLVSIFIRDRGFRRKSDEYNEINTVFLLRDNVYLLS